MTQLEAIQQQVKEVRAEVKLLREVMTQMALAGQRLEGRVTAIENMMTLFREDEPRLIVTGN